MPSRNYTTDPKKLLAEGKMIVSSTDDAKYQHRVECVNIVLGGMAPSELSKYVAESKNTITGWVKTADEQGFDALHPKKQPGRPKALSDEQISEMQRVLDEDSPDKYGYRVWDGPTMSQYMKEKYGVSISARTCQRMFHEVGFSMIRPQTFPSADKDNSVEREEFKKN